MKPGLTELTAVLAVARKRNFRAAADELGMSRSALSHAVSALERRIGVRLFNRTTRSVSLTEAGEQFVASVAPALGDIRSAMAAANSLRTTPAGTLRINTSAGAARMMMTPIVLAVGSNADFRDYYSVSTAPLGGSSRSVSRTDSGPR